MNMGFADSQAIRSSSNRDQRISADIINHIEHNAGPAAYVYRDIQIEELPIDIHVLEPCEEMPYYTLITCGMSAKPMRVPAGMEAISRVELTLHLAADWPIREDDFMKNKYYWPVAEMIHLARYPHIHDAWIWLYHVIPNGNPPQPFAPDTAFNHLYLRPEFRLGREFYCLNSRKGFPVYFLNICPLFEEEQHYCQSHGYIAFNELIDAQPINIEIVDNRRRDICKQLIWK